LNDANVALTTLVFKAWLLFPGYYLRVMTNFKGRINNVISEYNN